MSLQQYRRKRSFDRTAEPAPGKRMPKGQRPIFVVQLHHASRRHYDFRLQVGDVLRSWAVPKGPSYDPAVKRMAVEVEDHPLDYASFQGQIPQGEYGGGHVARFDQGVWNTDGDAEQQLAKGHLRFELFGDKLKGGWHLVRSGKPARQPQWLLFKDKDDFAGTLEADDLLADVDAAPAADVRRAGAGKARRKALTTVPAPRKPRTRRAANKAAALDGARQAPPPTGPFEVQLAKLVESAPQGEPWVHELKWDGYRIAVTVAEGEVKLWSRNGLDWTAKLPDIRAAVEALGLASAALDGELIAGRGSREDFNLLQSILSGERQGALSLVLFDLLYLDGMDVSAVPLVQRKALLQQLLQDPPAHLAFSSHIEGDAQAAVALATEQQFEGIISKRGDRGYHAGRNDDWRKTKELQSDEFAVVGYTAPKGSRTGFGSLLLARPQADGRWVFAGRVGTGFNDTLMKKVVELLPARTRSTPSVPVETLDTDLRGAKWFAPRFVVEVFYRGMGRQQLLRQPSLKGLRPDKDVADLRDSDRTPAADAVAGGRKATKASKATKATTASKATSTKKAAAGAAKAPAAKRGASRRGRAAGGDDLPTLSSPTKLLFAEDRISKQQVWDYYLAVAPQLLPELVGRPLSVVRCPAGTAKACFFQKHLTAGLERVGSKRLKEESGASADYLVVEDLAGLMELVQFNALEFHPWGALARTADRADRVVFDLDPGSGVAFAEVKQAALHIRKLLQQLKLESFLRTSGGKGLHVVVPLQPGCDWDLVKRFARSFAEALAQSEPERFLATASKKLRNKRIFVDYLRNGRGATAVASYSLRARPGAPVAMPLAWSELSRLTRADAFTLKDVPAKLKRRRKDPWEGIDSVRQNLSRWAKQG